MFLKGRILLSDDHTKDSVHLPHPSHLQEVTQTLLADVESLDDPDGEDLLLLLADEATQQHRTEPGSLYSLLSPAARSLLERHVHSHDWQKARGRVCLGTAVRALVQLTVDVNNLPSVVEGDRAAQCLAYLDGLLRAMEVGSLSAAER